MSRRSNRRQSLNQQHTDQLIAKLQMALAEALDQNEILRNRVIELQALLVAAQQLNQDTKPRSRQKPTRVQPSRRAKQKIQYRNLRRQYGY